MPKKAPMKKSDSKPRGKAQKSKIQKSKSETLVPLAELAERENTDDVNMADDPLVEGIDQNMIKQEVEDQELETEAVVSEEVGQISANAPHITPEMTVKIEPESLVMEALINPPHGTEAHSNPTPAPATVSTPVQQKKKKTAAQRKKDAIEKQKLADDLADEQEKRQKKRAKNPDRYKENVVQLPDCSEFSRSLNQENSDTMNDNTAEFLDESHRNVTDISNIGAEQSSPTLSNNVSLHHDSNERESETNTDIDLGDGQEPDESMDMLSGNDALTSGDTEEGNAKCSMSKIVSGQSVKRPGSPIASAFGSRGEKRSRKQVEIPERVWIETLKSLSCPKWSKMRLVSHKLNGLIEKNVSRLPMAIIDRAEMSLAQRKNNNNTMIASDLTISPDQKEKWFKDRGVTLHLPALSSTFANIELNNEIIGFANFDFQYWCVDLVIQGDKEKFNASVLFNAVFSPQRNPYSWPSVAYFLKMIYDRSTFVKQLSMKPLDKQLKDILFTGEEERYIRCGTINLAKMYAGLCKSLPWLEQNVQADKIENIRNIENYYDSENCVAVCNFLFGASWISGSQVVKLGRVDDLDCFFRTLIQKFRSLVATQSTFPIMEFRGSRNLGSPEDFALKKLLSGKEKVDDSENAKDSDASQSDGNKVRKRNNYETYTIPNGSYRMHVAFVSRKSNGGPGEKAFDIRVTVEAGQ